MRCPKFVSSKPNLAPDKQRLAAADNCEYDSEKRNGNRRNGCNCPFMHSDKTKEPIDEVPHRYALVLGWAFILYLLGVAIPLILMIRECYCITKTIDNP